MLFRQYTVYEDMKVHEVAKFKGTCTALQEFLDKVDTFFEMKLASFPVGDHGNKIMYIQL